MNNQSREYGFSRVAVFGVPWRSLFASVTHSPAGCVALPGRGVFDIRQRGVCHAARRGVF